jgi:hypothetical protein
MAKHGRRYAVGISAAALAASLAACTEPPPNAPGKPPTSPSAGITASPSGTSAVVIPNLPAPAGKRTLAEVPARGAGSYSVTITANPGDLIIRHDCTGGVLKVQVDPIATFPINCEIGKITPAQNVINLREAKTVTIRVDAAEGVQWTMTVGN